MDGLGKRMRSAMDQRGFSDTAVAARLGVKRNTFNHWVNDRAEPKFEVLLKFCDVMGVEIGDILRWGDDDNINFKLDEADTSLVKLPILQEQLDEAHFDRAKAKLQQHEIAISSTYLDTLGLDPAHLALVVVQGDKMAPLMPDGMTVLIDQRDREISSSRSVCVFRMGEHIEIAQLACDEHQSIFMIFENHDTPLMQIRDPKSADFEVLGKVVWAGNRWSK